MNALFDSILNHCKKMTISQAVQFKPNSIWMPKNDILLIILLRMFDLLLVTIKSDNESEMNKIKNETLQSIPNTAKILDRLALL